AAKALRDGHHGYTPANGILPLREAIAEEWQKRYRVAVDPGRILVVPGGKVTMFFAIAMLGEKGAEIVYPNPGFPIYESVIRWTGATPVALPLLEKNGFAFRAEDLLALVTPRTRLIIINSPANPTGGVTPRAEIDKLARGLEKFPDVVVMSDEIYGRIVYDGNEHVSLLGYESLRDRLILLDGFSKTYAMTGWRVGYALWPGAMIEGATRLAVNCHSCVNAASQWAGIAALKGPQDAVDRMVKAFDERRRYIVGALNQTPGLACVEPGGAFYAFPNITGTGMTARQAQVKLLEEAGV
ncbi:MAG: aminotransferase class I/II-fold pyridoxal phosphate-dependent enzyme, partial [Planctomycetes bacterium]|nr:aminotransferase class I/II-fold pyridoxal phosphate-dependent enzyme [Planctomycetota bacterium]